MFEISNTKTLGANNWIDVHAKEVMKCDVIKGATGCLHTIDHRNGQDHRQTKLGDLTEEDETLFWIASIHHQQHCIRTCDRGMCSTQYVAR